ncbi:MAG: isocitrate lyase/PEP mutase family protein [Anaerolineales bacterium]|nr:isocitrate lyase/PEP mutase family protein [Anaerolineales bacterium]
MEEKNKFRDLLSEGQVFAPCVYDCLSARAADLCGFKSLMLSGGAVSYSMDGLPDMGFSTIDEIVWITERITNVNPLSLIVDADDGFGESPVVVYRNMYRLVKAGAMGITIDDSTGVRGAERFFYALAKGKKITISEAMKVVPRDLWLSKVKATLAACEGTDCVTIARIGLPLKNEEGFIEAIERALRAKELGAEMIMVNVHDLEDAQRVARYVKGWKMWPDVASKNGVPNINLNDVYPLGFNFVTMHIFEKAVMYGMMKYGLENFKNQNSVYSEMHDMGGYPTFKQQMMTLVDHDKWIDLEVDFKNL